MKTLFAIAALLLVAGCVPLSPMIHEFNNSEPFDAPYEKVWQSVVAFFAEKDWPVEKIETESGVIVSEWIKDDTNGGDYGEGSLGAHILHDTKQMVVNIRVTRHPEGETRVRVTCFFRVQWSVGGQKSWGRGTSRGVVEKRILDSLRSRLSTMKIDA